VKEPTFDIFSGPSNNNAIWLEAVEGLANARARMHELAARMPGQYFVFSVGSHSILARAETFKKPQKVSSAA
jgi:hypothetical protein